MTAKRPEKSAYQTAWDYKQELNQWDENPLYGWCLKNKKADGTNYDLYRDGLKIYTTIDSRMQRYAEEALYTQMAKEVQPAMDAQVKATSVLFNDLEKEDIEKIINSAMRQSDRYRMWKKNGLTHDQIIKTFGEKVKMKVFTYRGERDTLMTPRDSILHYKRHMRAGFVAMDPSNGYVKVYVGGPSFKYFKYDAVKQGRRQVGSTIKPFIYTFAIDHLGLNPCTPVPNMPVTLETYNGDAWQPKEAGKVVYDGALKPLWWGLAQSRNNYSAWIMKQARQPEAVADFIHKMGIRSYIDPVFAMCLGTSDFSLYEMVGAYTIYANRGVYSEPMFVTRIEDRQGNLLAEFSVRTADAISEHTAYTMVQMMQNVVNKGTAGRLRWMYDVKGEVAGKTGTSQNGSDAWFMGVTPRLVAGAWVGGEDRSVRLTSKGEGATMALPIFAKFLKKVHADKSLDVTESDLFSVPIGAKKFDCDLESFGTQSETETEISNEEEFFD
jgi:penicillin-binding protein 1A